MSTDANDLNNYKVVIEDLTLLGNVEVSHYHWQSKFVQLHLSMAQEF